MSLLEEYQHDDGSRISCDFYDDDDSTISTVFSEEEQSPYQHSKFASQSRYRPVDVQLRDLSDDQRDVYDRLMVKWRKKRDSLQTTKLYSDEMILRFARNSNGAPFTYRTARNAMGAYCERFLHLNATSLRDQLRSKTLFPVPGLQTYGQGPILYMKPARYFPRQTPTKDIIDNLVYCMNTMAEDEATCRNGITFMALMNDWQKQHFCIDYCKQFMDCLQGKGGIRVNLFLIVNPPSWFGTIWTIIKPMLSESFRERVKIIPESAIDQFLEPGFHEHLPDDFKKSGGQASTEGLVEEFVNYRVWVENEHPLSSNKWLEVLLPESKDIEQVCENASLRWSAHSSNGTTCKAPPAKPIFRRSTGTSGSRWLPANLGRRSMKMKRYSESSNTGSTISMDVAPKQRSRTAMSMDVAPKQRSRTPMSMDAAPKQRSRTPMSMDVAPKQCSRKSSL